MSNFTWEPATAGAGTEDGGYTRTQHALYTRIKFAGQIVGLAKNVRWTVTTGTHFDAGIGDTKPEPIPGAMQTGSGSIASMTIRKKKIYQLMRLAFPNITAIDWRVLPFEIEIDFTFKSATGATTFEASNEKLTTCYVTEYGRSLDDAGAVWMENVSFIFDDMPTDVDNGQVLAAPTTTQTQTDALTNINPANIKPGRAGGPPL